MDNAMNRTSKGNAVPWRDVRSPAGGAFADARALPKANDGGLMAFLVTAMVIGGLFTWVSPASGSVIALGLFLFSVYVGYTRSPLATALLAPILAIRVIELAASIVLNVGVPLPEIGIFSYPTNDFYWLSLLYCMWPMALYFLPPAEPLVKNLRMPSPTVLNAALVLSMGYIFLILMFYAIYGAPIFSTYGKLQYYVDVDNRFLSILARWRLSAILVAGYVFALSGKSWVRAMVGLTYAAAYVLGADKMTSPILALCFFILPTFIRQGPQVIFRVKVIGSIFLVVSLMFASYFAGRYVLSGSVGDTVTSVTTRVPAQAQLWFMAMEGHPHVVAIPPFQAVEEVRSMMPFGDSASRTGELGQWRIAYDTASAASLQNISKYNVTFIMILYPYILKYYGIVPVFVLNIFLIGYTYFITMAIFKAVIKARPFELFVYGMILQTVVTVLISGNMSSLLGTNTYFLYILALGVGFFNKSTEASAQ
jgi:hypothetical protein